MGQKMKMLQMRAAAAHNAGVAVGAESFITAYEFYRRFSSVFFAVCIIYLLVVGMYLYALFMFGILHNHVLYNQLWWKLKGIEGRQ